MCSIVMMMPLVAVFQRLILTVQRVRDAVNNRIYAVERVGRPPQMNFVNMASRDGQDEDFILPEDAYDCWDIICRHYKDLLNWLRVMMSQEFKICFSRFLLEDSAAVGRILLTKTNETSILNAQLNSSHHRLDFAFIGEIINKVSLKMMELLKFRTLRYKPEEADMELVEVGQITGNCNAFIKYIQNEILDQIFTITGVPPTFTIAGVLPTGNWSTQLLQDAQLWQMLQEASTVYMNLPNEDLQLRMNRMPVLSQDQITQINAKSQQLQTAEARA